MRVNLLQCSLFWAVLLGCAVVEASAPASAAGDIRFNRDIRPILAERCYACHGPDRNARKGKLRLDIRDEATKEAIVTGKADESPLIARVTSKSADELMPPPESNKPPLTTVQVELLKRWINAGAVWEPHWAFVPAQRPPVPVVAGSGVPVLNPIDAFIQERLSREGLRPSAEADRRTLLRRLSFDLAGLPAPPDEVDRFVGDGQPDAYERLVDSFLASPHFGERLALIWLDVVRYADTDGFHADNYRSVYPYRDYVIDAFNRNMPFDRFTIEQLGGDLLPNPTRDQKIASTYNRLNRTTEEGGAQAKEYLAKYAADRVRTTATTWLGATLGCAECHDHKFDPYTAKDFYSFEAFFADIKEQGVGKPEEIPVPTEQQSLVLQRFDSEMERLTHVLDTTTPELELAQKRWEESLAALRQAGQFGWKALRPEKVEGQHGTQFEVMEDQSVLTSGPTPEKEVYTIVLKPDQANLTGLRLEALTHESMNKKSLSRGGGNFVLTELEVETVRDGAATPVKIAEAEADFAQNNFPVAGAIDGKPDTGWAVDGQSKVEKRTAVFRFAESVAGGPGAILVVRLRHESKHARHNIGRFRLGVISQDKPALDDAGVSKEVAAILEQSAESRNEKDQQTLAKYFRSTARELDGTRAELSKAKANRDEFMRTVPRSLVTVAVEPRPIRVLPRGNWMIDSGDVVLPAVPEFLSPNRIVEGRATRLDLGKWLVSRENPLTARVFVNRLWRAFLGTGISRTLDDVGAQGEWPVHPELLDWLAVEFMDSGWDVKHMVKLLVMSQTYRQSSSAPREVVERDPNNRLLARQSQFRLPAEFIRDTALAVSGALSPAIGGPSVKPHQPAGFWDHLNFPKRTYQNDQGEAAHRRGLYTFWCRTFPHPSMTAFDAPSREECTAERVRSNTPLQALVLLNDPVYVEAARVFAERIVRRGFSSEDEGLRWAFREAVARAPRPQEQRTLRELFDRQWAYYRENSGAAQELVSVGDLPAVSGADSALLAAWMSVTRTLLNLNETLVRY